MHCSIYLSKRHIQSFMKGSENPNSHATAAVDFSSSVSDPKNHHFDHSTKNEGSTFGISTMPRGYRIKGWDSSCGVSGTRFRKQIKWPKVTGRNHIAGRRSHLRCFSYSKEPTARDSLHLAGWTARAPQTNCVVPKGPILTQKTLFWPFRESKFNWTT